FWPLGPASGLRGSPRREGAWPTSPILCVSIFFRFMLPGNNDRRSLDFCEPISCAATRNDHPRSPKQRKRLLRLCRSPAHTHRHSTSHFSSRERFLVSHKRTPPRNAFSFCPRSVPSGKRPKRCTRPPPRTT